MRVALNDVSSKVEQFINQVNTMEIERMSNLQMRERLEKQINELTELNNNNQEALEIARNAIIILKQVSDEAVHQAYQFLEQNLNEALSRMFEGTTRKIRLVESVMRGQYPQLTFELEVGNGKVRSLKADSGHGIAQIVSLLSVLCMIVITGSRRILVMDEVISGLSVHNRKIVTDILWAFTEIGFQFIINEHGYIPVGSKVYHLEMKGDVSGVKESYIAEKGVYLQGTDDSFYTYSSDETNKGVALDSDDESDENDEVGRNLNEAVSEFGGNVTGNVVSI